MVRIGILSTASIVGRFVAASHDCDNTKVVATAARDHDRAKAFVGILKSGELGRIQTMGFTQSYSASAYTSGWNRELAMGGGCWIANEAYFLYLAEQFAGRIEAWAGIASFGDSDIEEQCTALLRMEDNVLASCRISSHVVMENRLVIWCDAGLVVIPDYWRAREAFVRFADGSERVINHPCEHEMRYELEHYCSCIERGLTESPVTSSERSVHYLDVTGALRTQMGLPDYPTN